MTVWTQPSGFSILNSSRSLLGTFLSDWHIHCLGGFPTTSFSATYFIFSEFVASSLDHPLVRIVGFYFPLPSTSLSKERDNKGRTKWCISRNIALANQKRALYISKEFLVLRGFQSFTQPGLQEIVPMSHIGKKWGNKGRSELYHLRIRSFFPSRVRPECFFVNSWCLQNSWTVYLVHVLYFM